MAVQAIDLSAGLVPTPSQSGAIDISAGLTPKAAPTADTRSLWQKAEDNFNSNAQGAQPGDNAVEGFVKNVSAGGADVVRSIAHAVAHPLDTIEASQTAASQEMRKPISQVAADTGNQIKTMVTNPGRTIGQFGVGALIGESGLAAPKAIAAVPDAVQSAVDAIPSRANAASVFNDLNTKLATQPVPLSDTVAPLQRATEIGVRGGSLPKPISDLLTRSQSPVPMTFPEARDYQMSLTDLSREQQASLTPRMKAQVAQVNQGLFNDIHAAAESAQPGLGSDFANAMKEYRQASQVKNAIDAAKKIALPVAATAIAGGGGALALRYLSEIGK
jgi:hypothetical protein